MLYPDSMILAAAKYNMKSQLSAGNSMIVGIGELLWDIYPDGRKVAGGAPFNFAFHCHQLGHPAAIVSRVGDDVLGRELREEVRRLGLGDEWIQTDREHPTGTVTVSLDATKVPTYTIAENVAWDYIESNSGLERLAATRSLRSGARESTAVDAVCFGTLAQRSPISREAIQHLIELKPALRVFDVNLRQRYYSLDVLKRSIAHAHWVKLNEEELMTLARLYGRSMENVYQSLLQLCFHGGEWPHVVGRGILSRGGHGFIIVEWSPVWDEPLGGNRYNEEWLEAPAAPAHVVDTVGAGDAFTAAMACLHLEGRPLRDCARFANYYAARVCEYQGATPRIDRAEVERAAFGSP
jgi:fructokinase